jgi:hypothetical protein
MKKVLFTVNEVKEMINAGKALVLAGEGHLLRQLPAGNWIGGTIPYKLANPVADYVTCFNQQLVREDVDSICFSCNCILNFLYSELEGKHTGLPARLHSVKSLINF